MKKNNPVPHSPAHEELRQRLSELRDALLTLHKALVESERESYEQAVGPIQSPNHFLQLLTRDPWFVWLQPFSQIIVAMDEVIEEKEPLTPESADALVKQISLLLVASESAEGFGGHYFAALQRNPNVVLAHADVAKIIRSRQKPSSSAGNQ